MNKVDNVNKTKLVLEADQAIKSIVTLRKNLEDISSIKFGNIKKEIKDIENISNGSGSQKRTKEEEKYQSLLKKRAKIIQETEKAFVGQKSKFKTVDDGIAAFRKINEQVADFNSKIGNSTKSLASLREIYSSISKDNPLAKIVSSNVKQELAKNNDWKALVNGADNVGLAKFKQNVSDLTYNSTKPRANDLARMKADAEAAWPAIKNVKETIDKITFKGFNSQISAAKLKAEELYIVMAKTPNAANKLNFSRAVTQYNNLCEQSNRFNSSLNGTDTKMKKIKKKFIDILKLRGTWAGMGMVLNSIAQIPSNFIDTYGKVEQGMAGIEQVMESPESQIERIKEGLVELGKVDIAEKLTPDLINVRDQLHKIQEDVFNIASDYGEKVEDIIEGTKLWGRAYKDIDIVNVMTRASATLAVADSFDIKTANKALESSVMQWQMHIENTNDAMLASNKIIDSWTNLAHNYTVSAQTLATANERMASSAKLVGVSFDFAQALVSVMARKTQAEGAEIGNAMKSIFASIHSTKAIKEIEALGVSVYKVENGVKSFRKVEDVLVDVMMATRNTKANVEDLFKAMAGGKWQWNKMGALVDYKEFVTALNLSINSQGMAARQVAMQMDTLVRKIQNLKTEAERLLASQTGAGETLKFLVDLCTNFLKILNHISPAFSKTAITMGLLYGLVLRMAPALVRMKNCLTATTIQTTALTTAQRALNVAIMANPITGTIGKLLKFTMAIMTALAAASGIKGFLEEGGAGKSVIEKNNLELEKQQAILENIKNQRNYIPMLVKSYREINQEMTNSNLTSEESKKKNEELAETKKALTKIIGEEGIKRVEAAEDTQKAIDTEIEASNSKEKTVKDNLESITQKVNKAKKDLIKAENVKIELLDKEAESWWDLVKNVSNAIGAINGLLAGYYRAKASFWDGVAEKFKDKKASDFTSENIEELRASGMSEEDIAKLKSADDVSLGADKLAKQYAQDARDEEAEIKNTGIVEAYQKIQGYQGGDSESDSGDNSNDTGSVNEDSEKGKGKAGRKPKLKDWTRDKNAVEYKKMLADAEIAAKRYESELAKLNATEDIYGKTVDTTISKFNLMGSRYNDLVNLSQKYNEESKVREEKADNLAASNDEIVRKLNEQGIAWKDLSKEEKEELISLSGLADEQQKQWKQLLTQATDLNVKAEEASKKAIELKNAIDKAKLGDTQKWDYKSDRRLADIEHLRKMQHYEQDNPYAMFNAKNSLGIDYAAALTEEREHSEKLKHAREELSNANSEIGQADLDRLKDNLTKAEEAYAESAKKVKDIEMERIKAIREAQADFLDRIIVQQESFEDIWNDYWKRLASEAIKRMMGISTSESPLMTMFSKWLNPSENKSKDNDSNYNFENVMTKYQGTTENLVSTLFLNKIATEAGTLQEQVSTTALTTGVTGLSTSIGILTSAIMQNTIAQQTAALSGGGSESSPFGFVSKWFGNFANGGSLEGFANGGNTQDSGKISGAGTGRSDSILAYLANKSKFVKLSNGEYVINQKTAQELGIPFLDQLNQNGLDALKHLAGGGNLGDNSFAVPSVSSSLNKSHQSIKKQDQEQKDNTMGVLQSISSKLDGSKQSVTEHHTYQIQAVDAASFCQLLNRNSDVLAALIRKEQGRRN